MIGAQLVTVSWLALSDVLVQAPVVQHCADAERILQDVQRRRKNLETNLQTIQRQRAQEDLYVLVDSIAGTSGYRERSSLVCFVVCQSFIIRVQFRSLETSPHDSLTQDKNGAI